MTISAKGNRGSWFAEVDGERLPCIHEYWLKNGRYNDPGCMPSSGRWPKFIKGVRDGRAILTRSRVTNDSSNKSGKRVARTGYIGVVRIADVEADNKSLRFRIENSE